MSNAEARGRLRLWKQAAAKRYAAFDRATNNNPELLAEGGQMVMRALKGRARAFRRLRRLIPEDARFEGACLAGKFPVAVWAMLRPRNAVTVDTDNPSLRQDCVVTEYLVVGAVPEWTGTKPARVGRVTGKWSLEVPDHALLRLLQRSPGVDIGAVLWSAHAAALRARVDNEQLYPALADPARTFLLPAGDGVFVCGVIIGEDIKVGLSCHLFAHTWLHNDQLYDNQTPLLVEAGTGARLGEGLFLPSPLHKLAWAGDDLDIEPWGPGVSALGFTSVATATMTGAARPADSSDPHPALPV